MSGRAVEMRALGRPAPWGNGRQAGGAVWGPRELAATATIAVI